MIDPNKPIAQLISQVCQNVELEFPGGEAAFPLATLNVINNSSEVVLDGRERFSSLTVQIDVWDNEPTRERCEEISCGISDVMIRAGFSRNSAGDIKEEHLHRKSMTFSGTADNITGMIYERS